ncbi:UNVERIFIED_CONTAM: hypothetical protein Sradi_6073400 [Sesamum radiatum]|uniref:Uncharacterized protein n=1 Tax=Sesamum radiatum TaxID=300843 RepID=A0AAW2KK28_SESRA
MKQRSSAPTPRLQHLTVLYFNQPRCVLPLHSDDRCQSGQLACLRPYCSTPPNTAPTNYTDMTNPYIPFCQAASYPPGASRETQQGPNPARATSAFSRATGHSF